jgi:hypothetical protein
VADQLGEVYVEIGAKIDKLVAELERVKKLSGATAKKVEADFAATRPAFDVSRLTKGIGTLVTGFFALQFMKKSLADWGEQENASNRLAVALTNAGVAAKDLGSVQAEMEAFSTGIMKVTTFGDEAVTDVQAMLTAMTGLTGKGVQPLVWATLNLAEARKMDAQSAAMLVAKTIEGQNALGRYGIVLGDTANKTEKVAELTNAINAKFNNFATNALNTTSGKMKNLANVVGEARESFGKLLAEAITPLLPGLAKIADFIGKAIPSAVLALQGYFAELFAGVATYTLTINAILPGPLKILSEKSENFLKHFVANGLKIAANAKAQFNAIWATAVAPVSTGGGGRVTRGKALSAEEKKQRLDAARELTAAENKVHQQAMDDEFQRRRRVIADNLTQRLQEIKDMKALATDDKPVDDVALGKMRQAARDEAYAAILELDRDQTKAQADELKRRHDAYLSETKQYNKAVIDQQVRNYTLSVSGFKAYLDEQLELEIQQLESRNREVEQFNAKNKGKQGFIPIPLQSESEYRAAGQVENAAQTIDYAAGQKARRKAKWEDENKQLAEITGQAATTVDQEWGGALDRMIADGQTFADATTHIWTDMANKIISDILRIATEYAVISGGEMLLWAIFGGAHGGGDFMGTKYGVKKMAGGGGFTVPPGYPNDSFPLMVESGERVSVTPAGRSGGSGDSDAIVRRLDVLNMNLVNSMRSTVDGKVSVEVAGNIAGENIYLANRRASKTYLRNR